MFNEFEDQDYAKLVKEQLELYKQKMELFTREKVSLKNLAECTIPELKNEINEADEELRLLKDDRTKDQKVIFELERKIGVLEIHYKYDRERLQNNHEVQLYIKLDRK